MTLKVTHFQLNPLSFHPLIITRDIVKDIVEQEAILTQKNDAT